jgi:hypothetical protein
MGILDEAIREHLDLKRLHGAEDSEVKRLEDEAFGPPTRPGEPDFPESQEQPAVAEDGTSAEGPPEPPAGEVPEAATTLLRPEDAPQEAAPEGAEPSPEAPPAPEPTPSAEHPAVEAEAPEALPEPPATEEATEGAPAEEGEEEEASGGLFDQEAGELDLDDLDLDLGEEGDEDLVTDSGLVAPEPEDAAEAPPSEEAPMPEEAPPSQEPPVTHMETVEHPMEEELGLEPPSEEHETELEPPSEEHPESEEGEPSVEDEEEEGTGEGDVLEETPEFLQDRPEDDELWFEQGKPKDFDF